MKIKNGSFKFSRLFTLFKVFFTISSVTLGGGLVMLPLISREFTEKRQWMTAEEIMDIFAVVQSLPGMAATNSAVMVGYRLSGFCGALSALLGCVTPPFFVIVLLANLVNKIRDYEAVNGLFLGIRAAACAIILALLITMIRNHCKSPLNILLAILSFALIGLFGVNAIWIILGAATIGPILFLCSKKNSSTSMKKS